MQLFVFPENLENKYLLLFGARCQLCCWLSVWEAVSVFLALRRPDSSSQGSAAVRCQQNNHDLAVVRNDTRAAIDQQS